MIHYLFPNTSKRTNEFLSKRDWLLEAMTSQYVMSLHHITNVETVPLQTSEVGAKLEIGFQALFFFVENYVRNIACIILVKVFLMVKNNCSTATSTVNSTRPLTLLCTS
jgi:hypothetical protein